MRSSSPVLIVNWVAPIQVGALRRTIGIACPESASIIVIREPERISVFAESVDVRIVG